MAMMIYRREQEYPKKICMGKRVIKKVAVLGSGVMGSRIACHFAGVGIPVIVAGYG